MCCHTQTDIEDQTCHSVRTLGQPPCPSTDPKSLGAWQDCHKRTCFQVTGTDLFTPLSCTCNISEKKTCNFRKKKKCNFQNRHRHTSPFHRPLCKSVRRKACQETLFGCLSFDRNGSRRNFVGGFSIFFHVI